MRFPTRSLLFLLNVGASMQLERPATLGIRSPIAISQSYGYKIFSRQDCDGQVCADVCIPADAMCCDVIVGIYCEAGQTCTTSNTCIDDSSSSGSGSSTVNCSDDEKICGGGCISSENNCCSDVTGDYCLNGMECLSASSCDDTTGNGSGKSDSADDSDSSSSGDDDSSDDSYSYDNGNSTSDKDSSSSSGSSASGSSTSSDSGGSMITCSIGKAMVISLVLAIVHAN